MHVRLEHTINCDVARYWELYFDSAWIQRMFLEGLGYSQCEVQPAVEIPDGLSRSLRMTPKLNLPDVVGRALGRSLAVSEDGRFSRSTSTWTWQQRPSVLADKITIKGTVQAEPLEPGRCRRISEVTIEARLFGIGGLVERAAESNVRRGVDDSAAWINRDLAKNSQPAS